MKVFGNKKTKVAHTDNRRGDPCRKSLMLKKNTETFGSMFHAQINGYRACKRCKPE